MQQPSEEWTRYARAVIKSMSEVLGELDESSHNHLLETADYWFSLGLVMGIEHRDDARRVLTIILEHDAEDRDELCRDAQALRDEVLR